MDESNNDNFRLRRKELLLVLNETDNGSQIIIEGRAKKHNANQFSSADTFRGSTYRGVSKNKNKWQMMIMGNFKKVYVGAIENEREAAYLYDKIAIILHGLKVTINFINNLGKDEFRLHEERYSAIPQRSRKRDRKIK